MKFCPECGSKLRKNAATCKECGKNLKEDKKTEVKKTSKPKERKGLVIASFVIGIVALIFSLLINILVLPLAILGLVFGIVGKAPRGKKIAGIIMNSIAIVLSIIVLILLLVIFSSIDANAGNYFSNLYNEMFGSNKVEGKWYCKVAYTTYKANDYTLILDFKNNNKFDWKDYRNPSSNYVRGSYSYTTKREESDNSKYYNEVTLRPTEMYLYGRKRTTKVSTVYKMYITRKLSPRKSKMINNITHNTYYCEEK